MNMFGTLSLPFANGYAHHIRRVIDSSTMRRKNGQFDVKLSADDACAPTGRLIFRTSICPYLYEDQPDVVTNARAEMEFARELLRELPQIGGIYYDAGAGGGGATYSPEHLRYARSPLAPGPSISRMAGKYEFGRWMGEFLHRHGKIHFVNGGAGTTPAQTWHTLPFDCIGVEWPPVVGGERILRFLRTLAGHKPVSFLKIQVGGDLDEAVPAYVAKLGLYGIFPPSSVRQMGTRKRGASLAERVAPHAKVFQEMYLAGWQPVTYARLSNRRLRVERYGPRDGSAFFAVYNPTLAAADTELAISASAMGLPRLSKAAAFFSDRPLTPLVSEEAGVCHVSLAVPPRRLVVVQVGQDAVGDPEQMTDAYLAKHRAWRERVSKPQLVAHWTFDEGKGQIATDSSGNQAHAVLGDRKGTESFDPEWVAKGYRGSALRFDGKDDRVLLRNVAKLRVREAFTVEAWIKRTRRTTHARVIDFSPTCIYFEGDGDRVGLRIGGYSVDTAWSTPVPLGGWTHLKASYDGKTIRMFIHGKRCGTKEHPADRVLSGRPVTIGNAISLARPFAGLIDEVRIWNYAR